MTDDNERHVAKAAIARGPSEPLTFEQVSVQAPRNNEVLVKVVACGVCHTDLVCMQQGLPVPMPDCTWITKVRELLLRLEVRLKTCHRVTMSYCRSIPAVNVLRANRNYLRTATAFMENNFSGVRSRWYCHDGTKTANL